MASIPKVLTNKTVLTGFAASPMKASSLFGATKSSSAFKPVGSPFDTMGKVAETAQASFGGKMGKFTPDSLAFSAYMPAGMNKPGFVQSKGVSFR